MTIIILDEVMLVSGGRYPGHARWLTEKEKQLVRADLDADRRQAGPREYRFGEALRIPKCGF